MAEAVTALAGRVAAGEVSVRDAGLRGMITLRGDLADPKLRKVCEGLTGQKMPQAGLAAVEGDTGLCWMAPDEVLILLPYGDVPGALTKLGEALAGVHHLAVNVSDARALIVVEGAFAREVIAKLAPVDLHPKSFAPGQMRRSRLGQVAAAFWMRDADTFEVICFRSVADYAFRLLAASAKAGPVGAF